MSEALMHYGIKGMKWGIRRYQNKDGSLTPAGKKRYADDAPESEASKVSEDYKKARRSIKEMSDAELTEAVRRLETEKRYRDLNPEKVSAGKKFIEKVLKPAATDVAKTTLKTYLDKQLKKALGMDQDSDVDRLKKAVEKLRLQRDLDDLRKNATLKNDVERERLKKKLEEYKRASEPNDGKSSNNGSGKSRSEIEIDELVAEVERRLKEEKD